MKASIARDAYESTFIYSFTTLEALYERIKTLSEHGAYSTSVCIPNQDVYNETHAKLLSEKYELEPRVAQADGFIKIFWD